MASSSRPVGQLWLPTGLPPWQLSLSLVIRTSQCSAVLSYIECAPTTTREVLYQTAGINENINYRLSAHPPWTESQYELDKLPPEKLTFVHKMNEALVEQGYKVKMDGLDSITIDFSRPS
ncbi:hypothetical protein D3C81_1464290 [compost metagenome]